MPSAIEQWLAEVRVIERITRRATSASPPLRRAGPWGELLVRAVVVDDQLVVILDERPTIAADARASLTAREREILDAVSEGLTNAQIADRLSVAASTIAKHLEHIYAKLDVTNRAAAVVRATRRPDA